MISKQEREVYFDKYCKDCKHKDVDDVKDPCNDCLSEPMNECSHKPVYFKNND